MKSRYIKISLLAILAAICCVLAWVIPALTARADGVTLEGEGDNFLITETSYGKNEKFVYTATANFEHGAAAGLVFGADENSKWVFNIDREANRVKLIYFSEEVSVLREEWFIGNNKMTEGEQSLVNPKVANARWVQLKVVITPEGDKVHAEFYADNIRRFAFDDRGNDLEIDLNGLREGLTYNGGNTGFNCFNAKIVFDDIYTGVSDYSYYTELYRQQYHFSQFAHWNNDPNGLVYYNGYYHLYYQTYPYTHDSGAEGWGDMYWGHARSKDLAHWELLPIALFPDTEADGWGGGNGYMWSGSAMVYHSGTSETIDGMNWYPNGGGTGLLGFYTRDGGRQDQVIMSSDDGGLTWTKRKTIPQSLTGISDRKVSCRDPKVFPVEKNGDHVTLWGMAVTGQEENLVWFFKSRNLWDWEYAGKFAAYRPECPDVVTLTANDGLSYTVMTFTGRQYLVGYMSYDNASGHIVYTDLNRKPFSEMRMEEIPFQTMDYGPDSYATQSFYIDEGEYNGKTVALSWFSGVPDAPASINAGALGAARKGWNGGGMTIPVEYGLVQDGNGYVLTQTPIVLNSQAFDKTPIYSGENVQITPQTDNVLEDVDTHCFELEAEIANPSETPVYFRINMNASEYTEIGWNAEEGYYVSREHTGDAGLNLGNYHSRHKSGAVDGTNLSFYILSDNGGIEVYCDSFKIPFYVLTFSSPYATKAQFFAESEVTASIEVNEISSVWRGEAQEGETVIHVETQSVELDKTLTPFKEVMAYATSQVELNWAVESGENVVAVEKTAQGAKLISLNAGTAVVTVTAGNAVKKINVTVHDGSVESDLNFETDGIVSGNWFVSENGLVGVQSAGDGFILSTDRAANFNYSANFSLSGAAAAIVFRAKADMSDYLIANYDNNGKIVKLWSPRGELGRASAEGVDVNDITLKVNAVEDNVIVYINDVEVINVILSGNEPTDGFFGLNTCAARTTFKSIAVAEGETIIRVETQSIELDKTLTPFKEIAAYTTSESELVWTVESGENVVAVEKTAQGAKITALGAGSAVVTVTCDDAVKQISVTVHDGSVDTDLTFNSQGKVSGNWFISQNGLIGVQADGDGFILSENSADNFTYSANFSLSGAAAAIVFRAKADMSDYLIANYDDNGKVVKLWSPRGELGIASAEGVDVSDITLKVKAKGNNVCVYLNGREMINVTLAATEPTEGLFGLNTCAARTTFKSVVLLTESYTYQGGNLIVKGDTTQAVTALYNRTLGNVKINPSFYTVNGRTIEISQRYFETLKTEGVYEFTAAGTKSSFDFKVTVTQIPITVPVGVTIETGCNAVIYIGNITVNTVTLNGVALTEGYSVKDGMLTIDGGKLSVGENEVQINDAVITVNVTAQETVTVELEQGTNLALIISLSVVGGVLVLGGAAAVTTFLLLRRKKKNGGND